MLQRIVALLLALEMLLSLSACAVEKETEEAPLRPESVPDYVAAEAAETAEKVLAHKSEDSFSLVWLSDLHVGYPYEELDWKTDETSVMEAGQGLHAMAEAAEPDLIVLGGDLASGGPLSTREDTLKELEAAAEYMRPATFFTPTLYLVGNHDDAPYRSTDERLTREEVFAHFGRKSQLAGAVSNEADPGSNYGYLDFPLKKMRVIYLDTNDKTDWPSTGWVEGDSGSAYMDACHVSARQLDWLANVALDFSAMERPADWGFLVVSHVPLDTCKGIRTYTDATSGESWEYNTDHVITVLTDYLESEGSTITLNGETAQYDFSGLTEKANLYACIHGHNHSFGFRTYGKLEIPGIGCPNVRDGREREGENGETCFKTPGTGDSTSFCVLTLDRTTRKLYADTYGAGPDREWELPELEQIEYTNLVARAVNVSGTGIFNDTGYRNDVRFSSMTNLPDMPGYVTTGIIQWRKEPGEFSELEPIYIRGVNLDIAEPYVRIALISNVNEEGYNLNVLVKGGEDSKWTDYFTIEELDAQYYRLTPKEEALDSWHNIRYFLLCAIGRGEDLVVTTGEGIEMAEDAR